MNPEEIASFLDNKEDFCDEDLSSGSEEDSYLSDKGVSDEVEDEDEDPKDADVDDDELQFDSIQELDWHSPDEHFVPKVSAVEFRSCAINQDILSRKSFAEIFHRMFRKSIYMYTAQCTNERINMYMKKNPSKKKQALTNAGEIELIIGCMFVMCYNKLPCIKDYWSRQLSLGNESIRSAISRDRFAFITSKMYFAYPEKSSNASKTYYVEDIVQCLKHTFMKGRQDSVYQSIDESMTKFKGRSSLKQYMPLKPVKRGIKMWLRCDSLTGYTYDFDIYCGKQTENLTGTLGERVVNKLISSVLENDVCFSFDRFFTSVNLMQNLKYAAVGTVMSNRKNLPKFESKKLVRGQSEVKVTSSGLLSVKWQDTKEVIVISNCHKPNICTVAKTLKTGQKTEIPCPEAIKYYREIMGGVDLADQMSGLYEYDRKSDKWWKKIFYRLIMMAAVNSWVIFNEMKRTHNKIPFKTFLVALAEDLIKEGLQTTTVKRSKARGPIARRSEKPKHLPIEGTTRRRCVNCSSNKKQTRTKLLCKECAVPLCKKCFAEFHS